ncbi:MAG: hypothetical protein LBJ00_00735 [Planctomycetaceae bacterium]|jgi:hypothetical protein|nr:hypothetical protein [Planctomycetaceae bacterium]
MKRIISFIDDLVLYVGERTSPMMVLEIRRQFNLVNRGTSFAVMYGIFGLLFLFVLLLPNNYPYQLINLIAETDFSGLVAIFFLMQFGYGIFMIPVLLAGLVHFYRRRDSQIILALSDVDLYLGLYQIGLFYMFKSFCLFYFWVVFLYILEIISFDLFAIFPVIWLFSVTAGNMLFSILAIFKRSKLFLFFLFQVILATSLLLAVYYVDAKYFLMRQMIMTTGMLARGKDLHFIGTWSWLPVVIVAFPIYFYVTLKVLNFNLTSKKSIYKKLFLSIAIYSILIVITIITIINIVLY